MDKIPSKVLAIVDYRANNIRYITKGKWYDCVDVDYDTPIAHREVDTPPDYYFIESDDRGFQDWYEVDFFETQKYIRNERLKELLG